jgi:hypothetical protein
LSIKKELIMQRKDKKFPIPGVIYSIASKGAGWFHYPFNTGENKKKLEELKRSLDGDSNTTAKG